MFPTTIVVAVDRSAAARAALEAAAELSRATSSPLHLVHVATTSSTVLGRPVTPAQADAIESEGRALLAEANERVRALGGDVESESVRRAESVDRALVQVQDELGAGLLVIGATTGGTVARALLGSTPTTAVRRSPGSVLVVRASERGHDPDRPR
jgi:nucleotide-binding universal stress UspA family protein